MKNFWKYLLTIEQASQSKVLISEPIYHSIEKKMNLISHFFETYETPAICLVPRATLSMIGSGVVTGFLIDSGDGVTQTLPLFEAFPIRYLVTANELAA